jgi:hypothetical protein
MRKASRITLALLVVAILSATASLLVDSSQPLVFHGFLLLAGSFVAGVVASIAAPPIGRRSPESRRFFDARIPYGLFGVLLIVFFVPIAIAMDLGVLNVIWGSILILLNVVATAGVERQREWLRELPPNTSGGTPVETTTTQWVLFILLCIVVGIAFLEAFRSYWLFAFWPSALLVGIVTWVFWRRRA